MCILVAIRRQANVMASHGSNAAQFQSDRLQTSVIKTMILVSAFFAVTSLPTIFYFLLLYRPKNASLTMNEGGYYATVFVLFLYTCTNPFIYATKFDPVKLALKDLVSCKRTAVQTPLQSRSATVHRSLQQQ